MNWRRPSLPMSPGFYRPEREAQVLRAIHERNGAAQRIMLPRFSGNYVELLGSRATAFSGLSWAGGHLLAGGGTQTLRSVGGADRSG